MTSKIKTFALSTTDNRKTSMMKKVRSQLSKILNGLEETKIRDADILICFSYTGEILSKKLFREIVRFQNKNKKCYVYSDYANSIREVIRVEKSEKNFETNSMYAIVIHAGIKIERYRALVDSKKLDQTIPQ